MTGTEKFGLVVNSITYLGFATFVAWRIVRQVRESVAELWQGSRLAAWWDRRRTLVRIDREHEAAVADIEQITRGAALEMETTLVLEGTPMPARAETVRRR